MIEPGLSSDFEQQYQHYQLHMFTNLLKRAQLGEAEALSDLCIRFLPYVYNHVASQVPSQHVAENITTEVFLSLPDLLPSLSEDMTEEEFISTLLHIARKPMAVYCTFGEKAQGVLENLSEEKFENHDDGSPTTKRPALNARKHEHTNNGAELRGTHSNPHLLFKQIFLNFFSISYRKFQLSAHHLTFLLF